MRKRKKYSVRLFVEKGKEDLGPGGIYINCVLEILVSESTRQVRNLTNMLMLLMILLTTCKADELPRKESVRAPKQFVELAMGVPGNNFYSAIYPKYFIYDVLQLEANRPSLFANGRPEFTHVSSTSSSFSYGGSPIYDYRIQLSPFFPGINSDFPNYIPHVPRPPSYPAQLPPAQFPQIPQIPQRPSSPLPPTAAPANKPPPNNDKDDDAIEKFDEKIKPSIPLNPNLENFDDDTVTIEAS